MNSTGNAPQNIAVTPSARAYLERLEESGLLEGGAGQQDIKGGVQPVLDALHHVLGGGSVSITIDTPGNATVVKDLNTLLVQVKDEWNKRPPGPGKVFF